VNGLSGYEPKQQPPLVNGLKRRDKEILDELSRYRPMVIVVDRAAEDAKPFEDWLRSYPGIKRLSNARKRSVYLLPTTDFEPASRPGRKIPVSSFRSNLKMRLPGELEDDNLDTIWFHANAQDGTEWVVVELNGMQSVAGVTLTQGPHVYGFPRVLAIETSADEETWDTVWQGPTSGLAFRAGLDDPRRVPITVGFEPRQTQFIRLRQLGSDPTYPWVIAELTVNGP
jgi:hypothetical protein